MAKWDKVGDRSKLLNCAIKKRYAIFIKEKRFIQINHF